RSEEHTSELQSHLNLVCACRIIRSEEHTSELQSHLNLVCRLLLENKKTRIAHAWPRTGLSHIWTLKKIIQTPALNSFFFFFLMIRRPPRSTLYLHSFPTRRSSD